MDFELADQTSTWPTDVRLTLAYHPVMAAIARRRFTPKDQPDVGGHTLSDLLDSPAAALTEVPMSPTGLQSLSRLCLGTVSPPRDRDSCEVFL